MKVTISLHDALKDEFEVQGERRYLHNILTLFTFLNCKILVNGNEVIPSSAVVDDGDHIEVIPHSYLTKLKHLQEHPEIGLGEGRGSGSGGG